MNVRKSDKLAIGLTVIVVLCLARSCFAFDDGDFQYWNSESLSYAVNDNWKLYLEEEFRFGDDADDFYYQHSDGGIIYSGLAKWLELGANYRHIFEKSKGKWFIENRPHLNVAVKWKAGSWSFSNRGRFEYRSRQDREDFWRYRNKFTVKWPFKLTVFEIQPYIADEIFYDFDEAEMNRNRLYTGSTLKLLKNLKADIFYLWQNSEKNNDWKDLNVFGTKLKFYF